MPRYARLASQLLARADRTNAVCTPDAETRARAIDAVATALATRARARRLRVRVAAVVAAAAVVLVFTAFRHIHRTMPPIAAAAGMPAPAQVVAYAVGGASSVVVGGTPAALASGSTLIAGSRLVTPATGRAMLSFSTGTSVVVGEATELAVATEGNAQVLHLDAGWIDLHVAKLAAGQRFLVETSDTEVEVHGTQFRVDLAPITSPASTCAGGARTGVRVTEGVVTVRHGGDEVRLLAGDLWPRACAAASVVTPATLTQATYGAIAPGSTLREQNDLFARAVAAKRRGDATEALATLDRFLVMYPASPLLESVVVERMRGLRGTAPSRAVAVARDYLARYPRGYARTEAEAIVTGGP